MALYYTADEQALEPPSQYRLLSMQSILLGLEHGTVTLQLMATCQDIFTSESLEEKFSFGLD